MTSAATPIATGPSSKQCKNAVSNCNEFAIAKSGEYCSNFARDHDITRLYVRFCPLALEVHSLMTRGYISHSYDRGQT